MSCRPALAVYACCIADGEQELHCHSRAVASSNVQGQHACRVGSRGLGGGLPKHPEQLHLLVAASSPAPQLPVIKLASRCVHLWCGVLEAEMGMSWRQLTHESRRGRTC